MSVLLFALACGGCVSATGVLFETAAPTEDTGTLDTGGDSTAPGDSDSGDSDSGDAGVLPSGVPGGSDLAVRIEWTHAGDDLDLHLLAPGGELTTDTDCHYANCQAGGDGLEWGEPGDHDNPVLLEEDVYGTGPEVIYIEAPADGTYTVVVHDYPGSHLDEPNPVDVEVFVDGEAAWSQTVVIESEDTYYEIAAVSFPGGAVEPLSGEPLATR